MPQLYKPLFNQTSWGTARPINVTCVKRIFSVKRFLMQHKQVHSKIAHHTCCVWENKYRFWKALNKQLLSHGKKKSEAHPCKTGGRRFGQAWTRPFKCKAISLWLAWKRLHSPVRFTVTPKTPYQGEEVSMSMSQCETCGKCFTQSSTLNIHRRVYSEVMPWKCSLCDKSFRRRPAQCSPYKREAAQI